jgi:hypothetical protein
MPNFYGINHQSGVEETPFFEKSLNWKGNMHIWQCRAGREEDTTTSEFDAQFDLIWAAVEENGPLVVERGFKRHGPLRSSWLACRRSAGISPKNESRNGWKRARGSGSGVLSHSFSPMAMDSDARNS